MSKISISLDKPTSDLEVVKFVREMTGLSLSSVRSRLQKGHKGIFYTTELFLNDHKDRESEIRSLVSGLEDLGRDLFIMELSGNESWEDVTDFEEFRIPTRELISLLDNCERYE